MHTFLSNLADQWAAVLVSFSALVAGAITAAEKSKTFAKMLGPLGGLIRGRAERKRARLRAERQAEREEEEERRDARREREAADIADLKRQVEALTERMPLIDQLTRYHAYETGWHARNDIRLAAAQIELERRLTFDEWCAREERQAEADRAVLRVYQGGPMREDDDTMTTPEHSDTAEGGH